VLVENGIKKRKKRKKAGIIIGSLDEH